MNAVMDMLRMNLGQKTKLTDSKEKIKDVGVLVEPPIKDEDFPFALATRDGSGIRYVLIDPRDVRTMGDRNGLLEVDVEWSYQGGMYDPYERDLFREVNQALKKYKL